MVEFMHQEVLRVIKVIVGLFIMWFLVMMKFLPFLIIYAL
jgi:hypothetical protein